MELAERVRKGDLRAIARAISWIENDHDGKEALIDALYPHCGNAALWGLTGPPGSGKSTLLDKLITRERQRDRKVAVIAVDPSSPFSGGAILGDRLRMQKHAVDPGVFIRSMASRGHLGGVAGASGDALKVFDAAGFDTVIIETIGVGQTEIDIVEMADMVMLVLVPGLGDEIQALKAGVMEIGDIFIVNKSDKDEANKVKAEIEYVLGMKEYAENEVKNPIFMTSATQDKGIDELIGGIDHYFERIRSSGQLDEKRRKRIASEIKAIIYAKVKGLANSYFSIDNNLSTWVDQVYSADRSPYSMINEKLNLFLKEFKQK